MDIYTDQGTVPDAEIWKTKSVEEIIALLKREQIKGKRIHACECPISKYFMKLLGPIMISTNRTAVACHSLVEIIWVRKFKRDHPISIFTMHFDMGSLNDFAMSNDLA